MHRMLRITALGLVVLAPISTSLAASKSPKLSRCDGKHRRPANIYGSILPTVDPLSGAMTPATPARNGVEVFPQADPAKPNPRGAKTRRGDAPPIQVPPISAIVPATSYGSC